MHSIFVILSIGAIFLGIEVLMMRLLDPVGYLNLVSSIRVLLLRVQLFVRRK